MSSMYKSGKSRQAVIDCDKKLAFHIKKDYNENRGVVYEKNG